MDLPPPPPPPQANDPIITQFKPVKGQWELNDKNIKRIGAKTGQAILHNYCQYINTTPLEVYRYLIETKGRDVNVQDKDKDTPLHCAFQNFDPNDGGDINVLLYLLGQKDVNVNTKGRLCYTLLHRACENINNLPFDIFKLLIETMGGDLNARGPLDNTPLHYAFSHLNPNSNYNITVLTYLLSQKGADVNTKNKFGYTLLHKACSHIKFLSLDVFKLLIETHGADVNAQDDNNHTPLRRALDSFTPDNITVLIYLLSQEGVNVNIRGRNGDTLLHRVCANINKFPIEILKLLIETHGADVNVQDNNNDAPLHYALDYFDPDEDGDIAVLYYLLNQSNVSVNIKGQHGYTLLHRACEKINNLPIDVFKVLVETHGGDVNAQDGDKNTPIHSALEYFDPNEGGDINVLTYLLNQSNVNVNIKNENDITLLHRACEKISVLPLNIFKLLIETHGADVNALDHDNDTPLCEALYSFSPGVTTVLKYLLSQKDVDVNIKDQDGYTLLHLACILENSDLDYDEHVEGYYDEDYDDDEDYEDDEDEDDGDGNYSSDDIDSDEDLEDSVIEHKLNAKCDTILCPIVEIIIERCVEQVLNGMTP
jgi:ankyrin repeat protein